MATTTANYNLIKDEMSDTVNASRGYQDENMDIIDNELKRREDILITQKLSTERLNKDSNGIFAEFRVRRADGTLFKKSVLSGGASPKYTTQTVTYYQADGVSVSEIVTYNLIYTDDELTSKVVV